MSDSRYILKKMEKIKGDINFIYLILIIQSGYIIVDSGLAIAVIKMLLSL